MVMLLVMVLLVMVVMMFFLICILSLFLAQRLKLVFRFVFVGGVSYDVVYVCIGIEASGLFTFSGVILFLGCWLGAGWACVGQRDVTRCRSWRSFFLLCKFDGIWEWWILNFSHFLIVFFDDGFHLFLFSDKSFSGLNVRFCFVTFSDSADKGRCSLTLLRLIYFDVFSYGFFGVRNRCLPFLFGWSFWCSWDLLFFYFFLWCWNRFSFGYDWCFFMCFGLFNWLGYWSWWSRLWRFNNGFWSFHYWVSLWSLSNLWLLFNCLGLWSSWICLLFHRSSRSRS